MLLRIRAGWTAMAAAVAAVGAIGGAVSQRSASSGLPGARPEVDASRYPTLQAALDALPPEGGLVRLPAGVFEISRPLLVRHGDVTLEGVGGATHIKNVNTEGQPALVVAHPDSQPGRRRTQAELWRVRLANFRITGNPQSGHGIVARGVNELFVQGVSISEHGGDGIHMDHCYEDPRIADCLITYNKGVGLNLVGCHDIVVSANQFEENQDALHCIDGYNLTMSGNALDDHLGDGVVIENTYGSVVAANMIEECRGAAIVLDRDCYGIALSANVIAHNGAGVVLRDAHGIAVSANALTIMGADALRIEASSGRVAVSGNALSDSYIGEGQWRRAPEDRAAGGVVLAGARHVGLTGNVLSGLKPAALALEGSPARRCLVAGNVLVDTASQHEQLQESIVGGNLADQDSQP